MSRNAHWYVKSGFYAERTSLTTWGDPIAFDYRDEGDIQSKNKWARREHEVLGKLSMDEELDRRKTYRFWLEGDDETDEELAYVTDRLQNVYDKDGTYVHTIVWF